MTSRYEDKFLIPLSYFSQVESLLDCGCIAFNKPYPSRIINSLYYDTDFSSLSRILMAWDKVQSPFVTTTAV